MDEAGEVAPLVKPLGSGYAKLELDISPSLCRAM